MARRRNRNRLARSGRGNQASLDYLRGDWVVSGQGLTAAGTLNALNSWGGQSVAIANGSPVSSLLVALPNAAASTGQPTIGQVEIAQVQGKVGIYGFSAAGNPTIVVAMYVGLINTAGTTWAVRDPSNVADANRDDYLFLDAMTVTGTTTALTIAYSMAEFRISLPRPIRIGGGEGLILTVANQAAITISAQFNVRSLIRQAA